MQRLIGLLLVFTVMLAGCLATTPERALNEDNQPSTMTPPMPTPTEGEDPTPVAPEVVLPTVTPALPALAPAHAQVDDLLARMSPEEKVGQLFLAYFEGAELTQAAYELIVDCHAGGIVLFSITGNIENPAQVARLTNALQSTATTHGAGVPLLIAVDQEGGPVVRLTTGATVFPSNMAVGATGSTELARQMARVTAEELRALGINMNLAPVLDVNSNPDNPVIGIRSFGSAPELVSELGTAMLQAYQAAGIVAAVKHFPGHGDTAVDSHVSMPVVDKDLAQLQRVELPPFQAAIDAGVDAIMTAHVLFPAVVQDGKPATLSADVLDGLLRRQMVYDGLIVSDSLLMGALDNWSDTAGVAELAVAAGVDLLAFGPDPHHAPSEQKLAYQHLLALVESGVISQDRLDASVRRILATKAKYGLLEWSPVDVATVSEHVGTPEHQAVAHEVALASVTLVKDETGALPLAPDAPVLLIWPARAGDLGSAVTAYGANVELLPLSLDPTPEEIAQAVTRAASGAKVIVATVNTRRFPGQSALVQALLPYAPAVIALGDPNDLLAFPDVPAYLATYSNVPVSLDAVAQILFGFAEPKGRLPVAIPGLFERGAGLSASAAG